MRNPSKITRAILKAYGYTTSTLVIDCDIPQCEAKRILHGRNELLISDLFLLRDCIEGMSLDFLGGRVKPGQMKAERERRDKQKAAQIAKEKAKWDAETKARQERWRNLPSQKKCVETASVILPLLKNCERYGYTLDDVFTEIIRQCASKEMEEAS